MCLFDVVGYRCAHSNSIIMLETFTLIRRAEVSILTHFSHTFSRCVLIPSWCVIRMMQIHSEHFRISTDETQDGSFVIHRRYSCVCVCPPLVLLFGSMRKTFESVFCMLKTPTDQTYYFTDRSKLLISQITVVGETTFVYIETAIASVTYATVFFFIALSIRQLAARTAQRRCRPVHCAFLRFFDSCRCRYFFFLATCVTDGINIYCISFCRNERT